MEAIEGGPMSLDTARDDLAFLRSLVQPDEYWQRRFGQTYAAGGLCYGVQMMLHGLQILGRLPFSPSWGLGVGLGPSVVFAALMIWIYRRPAAKPAGGVTSRAVNSVFHTIGLTNLAMVAIFASVAFREHSIKIWLIYGPVVLVLQGSAWLVAYSVQKRPLFAMVALGWFATGIAMAAAIEDLGWYILAGGVGFFAFMLAPGVILMRQARPA